MRVSFQITLPSLLRHFERVLLAIAARGHHVRIAIPDRGRPLSLPALLQRVSNIELVPSPPARLDHWQESAQLLRSTRDFLRYLDPRFGDATKLRTRALRKLVAVASTDASRHLVVRCPSCGSRFVDEDAVQMLKGPPRKREKNPVLENVIGLLRAAEDAMPSDPALEAFLRDERPDVLIVTPLVNLGSRQVDFIKAARALGIPTVYPVFSWDNLTTKGLIHDVPDSVIVWNEVQKSELVELHDVPVERIHVAGAPRFDDFFRMRPSDSYGEFCSRRGLDATQPTVTYLGSSEFVAGHENTFVDRWLAGLRAHEVLAPVNVVMRPHPRRVRSWRDWGGRSRPGVYLDLEPLPPAVDEQSLFDSLYHSRAAVGLNTSAEIEAGIVGCPVFTLVLPEFDGGQRRTKHFSYLLKPAGGFVEVDETLEEHLRHLAEPVRAERDRAGIGRFIERFVRPRGLDTPVAPMYADLIEQAAGSRRAEHAALRFTDSGR